MDKLKANVNTIFSANLGKKGRAASWFVAFLGAAAYTYWTNRENGQVFTKEDQTKWNASKEERNR